jgi:uncharacterized membrane protein YjjB (DUF3815 family)
MYITDILYDASFAAVAGIGFGAISDPPLKAFPSIAILSALGHSTRFCLMHYANYDIASASLIGALIIGLVGIVAGKTVHCPMTVLSMPALLPMVPGIYAYKTILALIMFLRSTGDAGLQVTYMQSLFSNFLLAFTTTFNLALGVAIPHFIFREKALSLTRSRNEKSDS